MIDNVNIQTAFRALPDGGITEPSSIWMLKVFIDREDGEIQVLYMENQET